MFKKVAFTMYPVKEIARARKFYTEVFGLEEGSAGNQGDNYWVEYDLPGGDLDRLIADLKSKDVTFKSDIIHSPVCRMAVCLDSEGNAILLHQLKPH